MLILGGLILAASAVRSVPKIGGELARAGQWLAGIGVVIGLILLVLGIIGVLGGFGRPNGPPR